MIVITQILAKGAELDLQKTWCWQTIGDLSEGSQSSRVKTLDSVVDVSPLNREPFGSEVKCLQESRNQVHLI